MRVTVASPEEMELFATRFARHISTNSALYPQEEPGAGKTSAPASRSTSPLGPQEELGAGKTFTTETPTPCSLYLQGELGAGKTTFVRGLLRGLGYRGLVKSPTYTLVESYHVASCHVYHFDLYRIATPSELDDIGYRDYFDGHGVCLVEWPERARGRLPVPDLYIDIRLDQTRREVNCRAHTKSGERYLEQISANLR